jgi:NAD(P)H-quinone oxidoreductase subunit 5
MSEFVVNRLFHTDALSWVMMALVGCVACIIASFASRNLKGDARFAQFYIRLIALILSVFIMVDANHLLLLLLSWGAANALLVSLMVHKSEWRAAKASGIIAAKNFLLGFVCLSAACAMLYHASGSFFITDIVAISANTPMMRIALVLLVIAVMTQSAIFPFHRWLLSSLNSPTPVSAMMHAGLINGGGFMLARFAPLYLNDPVLLNSIFVLGLVTACIGTLWKLMQHDIKRMLACSTMGQMGFMLAQCGLGLFPAAIAHLCWHGLFKAYLFLSSGSAAQEARLDMGYPPRITSFVAALVCGMAGAASFSVITSKNIMAGDTTLLLIVVAYITTSQLALTIMRINTIAMLPLALIASIVSGAVYGANVHLIEHLLTSLPLMQPQPLHLLHIIAMIVLVSLWLGVLFVRHGTLSSHKPRWMLRFYVAMLNAAQPHVSTITSYRNHYSH